MSGSHRRHRPNEAEARAIKKLRTDIGWRIFYVRTKRKLTQADLAGELYRRVYVSRIEDYQLLPTLPALFYFAHQAGLSLKDFLFNKRYGPPLGYRLGRSKGKEKRLDNSQLR